jgi:hypothetical protein
MLAGSWDQRGIDEGLSRSVDVFGAERDEIIPVGACTPIGREPAAGECYVLLRRGHNEGATSPRSRIRNP